ncbi:hypothetical protein, conserved [Babesia bigemina]|uniref:GOLD domain-containing protein n=1 Tax=Babesia bigemina TaxID=5866 RepID=A0A061DC60_BABBI|nr:hypothetical protein, conserved [Babesia bigemina]CDR97617.1 hypothetical protein, conserved [Babesia bigemina]|eukprot:XP_012769803.1 hypothetical protein, conserved [Babesia bigemina]
MKGASGLALALAICSVGVSGFYFQIDYNDERCFYESVPYMAMLSVNYDLLNPEARSCVVRITDDERKVLQSTNLKELPAKGRVTYVAQVEGTYHVCIECPGQMWYVSHMAKIGLSTEIADGSDKYGRHTQYDVDKETTAKKDEIKVLSEDLSKFAANIMNIKSHQRMESATVKELHDTYKNMYSYILYFYILQFVIIGATAGFSVYHITKFFKAYRIV